ncbi:hypothetical protein KP509_01G036300 [Ceratopteris richardii]|uniref:Uncharacterized protein n=1 Tax=Ceratopteris richardii TaxID=49495 RepID=A0A8T2VG31_CERRI|nr:hypothetical protein KP509_01G036300 [Ceratopteris richardii]
MLRKGVQTTTAATEETARRSVRDDGRMMSPVINKARRWIIRRAVRGARRRHTDVTRSRWWDGNPRCKI